MNWVFSKLLRNKSTNQEIRLGNQNEFSGVISPNKPIAVTNEPVEFTSTVDGVPDSRPYKVYSALLTQSSTDDPTGIVLENTLGDILLNYNAEGFYQITSSALFTTDKTVIINSYNQTATNGTNIGFIRTVRSSENAVRIYTENTSNVAADGILNKTYFEVRVYN